MLEKSRITMGILAPVDAGKTTLSESLLFKTGAIRKKGRVDHKDTFLDTHHIEKERGITIFSKQAVFETAKYTVTLLDTPGHADFSAEMERTLQVLDCAVLLVSAADGVTGYVRTLWSLLEQYDIPCFIFVNKMDHPAADRKKLSEEIRERLDDRITEVKADSEEVALCWEPLMESYLEKGRIDEELLPEAVSLRKVFPLFFGAALKEEGTDELLEALDMYVKTPEYGNDFSARIYKISRDEAGNRLTHMKITGGTLKPRQLIAETGEKVQQIRIYNGAGFKDVKEADAGTLCHVLGLNETYCGQGLGGENELFVPLMEPVLNYTVILEGDYDPHTVYMKLLDLCEEDPSLHIKWENSSGEITIQLMGQVQTEILKTLIKERFSYDVSFGEGQIVYKESVKDISEGVGHYEPLRHYAEVHLKIEPLERGEGIIFETDLSEDVLDRNWQRLIMTHLMEKHHKGVLTGADITDVKITLVAGRAHLKHTEGGDFRQATYRAVRHGLMRNTSILLEPYYSFILEIPSELTGRGLSDIQRMNGTFDDPETSADVTRITGKAPVSSMNGYHQEVLAYSRGEGRLYCTFAGYDICHNSEEVIEASGYNPEADIENTPDSVFCSHGAGFTVKWDSVEEHMHIKAVAAYRDTGRKYDSPPVFDDELKAIFEKTYGKGAGRTKPYSRKREERVYEEYKGREVSTQGKEKYLIVDGYNMIFSWEDKPADDIGIARELLIEELTSYGGYKGINVILVFDGYKVKGNPGTVEDLEGITVVYTKENQTADSYIETLASSMKGKYNVTVATSDYLEQIMVFASGAKRISARELKLEIEKTKEGLRQELGSIGRDRNYPFEELLKALK